MQAADGIRKIDQDFADAFDESLDELKEGRGTMPDGNDPDMDKKAPKLPFGIPQPPPVGASPEETKKWVESLDDKGKDLLKEWIESLSDDELGQLLP
jgi:hypothetical protein